MTSSDSNKISCAKKSAAIFDMDGVIVDTVMLHFEAWKKMFATYGITFSFEDYKEKVDGIPRTDGAKAVLTDLDEEGLKEAAAKKQDYFLEVIDSQKIDVYPSTISLIDQLRAGGIHVAVISSSKNCQKILTRIGLIDRLDAVVDGHAITKGKPDPQIFLMAAEKLGVSPEVSVVFEDALLGVLAGKNAGMYCVGIDRYDDPQRLDKADTTVGDLGELTEGFLKDLFNL